MSKKIIDERVVEMRFDNKQFESATKESMSTLDKLKQKLRLKDAAKGLDNLGAAVKKVDLNPLGKSAEMVTAKFSAMQVAGMAAIANLTNSAVNAGKNITKALTIEPVITGFQEYETQIGAIQTILANTQKEGTNVQRVNAALDELNLYADQTIYNFTEMTRNIGTFTAAGVKLDDSVSAIKGIANLAAVSGSTSLQASTAMYQLSQALAAGKVSLMDWNSVVNAGMGGQVFQDALIRTSENLKTGAKQAIATYGTFRESLTKGEWLTKEVLTETLEQLAGAYSEADLLAKGYSAEQAKEIVKLAETAKGAATEVKTFTQLWDTLKEAVQSGWGQTWRMIIGDFDEAKERMTKLSTLFGGIIEKASNRRNSMLSGALDSTWTKLTTKLNDAGIKTETFQSKIVELAKTHNVNLDEMIEKEGSFEKALRKAFSSGKLDKSILMDAIKSFTGGITESANAAKAASNQMEKYGEIANRVIRGDFGNGAERIDKLTKAGYEYAAVQNIVNERLGSSVRHMSSLTDEQIKNADSLANLSDEQLKSNGYTDEQITALKDLKKEADDAGSSIYKLINGFEKPSGVELAWSSVFNILDSITESCKAVKKAWTEIFHPGMTEDQIIAERSERLYKLLESIHAFTDGLKVNEETAQKITRTFKGLFAIIDLIRMVVGGALNIAFNILKEVLSAFDMDILDVTANVGDAIVAFHDWVTEHNLLAKAIKFVVPYIKEAVSAVSKWISNNETIQNGIKKLQSAFNYAAKGIQKWIDQIKEANNIPKYIISGLVNGIKNGAGLAVEAIVELGKSILEGIKAVLGIHSPSTEFFEIGKNMITGLINGIKEGVSSLLSLIADIGQKCIDVISKIDFSKIFTLAISAGIIYSGKKIYDLVEKFSAPFEGLGKMFSGIGNMFSSLGNVFNSFASTLKTKKWEIISKSILNFAIAIGVLAASIYVLSNIESDKLWTAVLAIGALAAIIGVLAFAMSKMSGASASIGKDGVKISGVKTALISLGIALLLLAETVKILGSLDPEQAKQGFLSLAGLVASIAIVLLAFGTMIKGKQAQNIDKFGKMLMKLSIALLLLVVVIKLLGNLSVSEITKGVICIVAFGGIMTGLVALTNLAGKNINKVGGTLLKMSAAMLLMVAVIKLLAGMSVGEITKGIACIAAFGGLMVGLIALTKLAGKDLNVVGSTILAMSGAMVLMAVTVKLLAGMSVGDMVKGIACIAAFGLIITGLIAATRLAGEGELKRVASTILAMSISIGILSAISVLLGLVDIATLTKGVTAVAILGTIMAAMIRATRGAENVKGNIITMTVAIGIMAAAIAILSFIDPSKLAGATIAMGMLMSIFAVMLKVAGTAQAAIAPMIVMSVVVGLLSGIIWGLSKLPIESVLGSAAALSILLLSMSASLAVLSVVGPTINQALIGAIGLLAMTVPLMAFVGVLAMMQGIKNAMSNAIILASFATVMTGLLVVLTGIGAIYMETLGVAATGILGLLAMAVPLMALVKILESMQGIQNAEANATILIDLMTTMTSMLTIVSILGPLALIGVGAITAVTVIVTALVGLAMAIGALNEKFPQLETFVDSGISLLSKLANGLGQVIGNFVSGFVQGTTSGLPEIATTLSTFMMNLTPFIVGAKMIDESVLTNVKTLAEIILALTGAGILEGIASWINGGESSITKFSEQLIPFGMAMVAFSNTVKGIDEGAVTAAANAGKMMAEMAKTIPREGGLWDKIAGEKDMLSFGVKLAAFGSAIKSFSITLTTGGTIDETAVAAAANVGKQMAEMADSIPKSGGIWQEIAGSKDIASFGEKMITYATSICKFATSIKGLNIDEGAMNSAINAGKQMAKMADVMPKSGGWWSNIAGSKDIASFGEKISAFGKAIKEFSESISSKVSGVDSAVSSINKLSSMLKNVSGVNAEGITSFKKSLSNLGKINVDGFVKSFNGAITNAKAAVTKFLKGISSAINNGKTSVYTNFYTAGKYLVDGFAKGITDNTFKAEAKARAMADAALTAAKAKLGVESPSKEFMKVGKFVAIGLAKGIIKNVGDTNKASVKMANGVLEATQDALGIHSPSIVFDKKVGRYIVRGIAEGIKKDMSAEEAAEKKAQNIVSAFQKELDKYDLDISTIQKKYNLWELTDGKDASESAKRAAKIASKNEELEVANGKALVAKYEYLETLAHKKEVGAEKVQEAENKWFDAMIYSANVSKEILDLQEENIKDQDEFVKNEEQKLDNDMRLWELTNGKKADYRAKWLYYDTQYSKSAEMAHNNTEKLYKEWQDLLAKGPSFEKEANSKFLEYQAAQIKEKEALEKIEDNETTYRDNLKSAIRSNIETRHQEDELWEAKHPDASDDAKYRHYSETYKKDWADYARIEERATYDYLAALAKFGKKSDETKEAWDNLIKAQTYTQNAKNKYYDHEEEYLKNEKEKLKDRYELASDIADLRYQIWEKTSGRNATDAEKDTMKLALLSEQLGAQAKLVKMAEKAWKEAANEDKQKYEKEYLNAQLELANLQNEVLDIQEANIKRQERALDRQRNAQSEYNDYIKKYEKYYLEHGMTREELEKDAKLVSGYNPNKTVSDMISKTKTATDNIKNNTQYTGLLSNFSEMGTSYATAVSDGIQNGISTVVDTTSTMIKDCADAIGSKKESWVKAGISLVEGLIVGIRSKIEDSVNAAVELASRTLSAIQSICDSDMDYSPTITPVLDMSNVSAGASRLNSMLNKSSSLDLASSVSRLTKQNRLIDSELQSRGSQTSGTTYSFTQINNSPKALSSVEIYRQTKNMFTTIRKKG